MAPPFVVRGHQSGQVIHTTAPACRPIGTILPGPISFRPGMVCHENREYLAKPCTVSRMQEMIPFCPGEDIWTGAGRIEAVKNVFASQPGNFPADESIRVLLSIEQVQGFLEIEGPPTIEAITCGEARIPHKDVAIEGCIHVIAWETILLGSRREILEGQLPGFPITIDD